MVDEANLDTLTRQNAAFWDELCGSGLARSIGITDASPESLARFDRAYFEFYPYLQRYVTDEPLRHARVLEIGLGYGTLGAFIASAGSDYYGLDIAEGAVEMMRARLGQLGVDDAPRRVVVGSALEIPHEDASFDYVYSIGCLHHTGDLERSVAEVHRILRPGGVAVVMLYNRDSIRQRALIPLLRALRRLGRDEESVRALYDASESGEAAPHTDYVSRADVRTLFGAFRDVRVRTENFDELPLVRGLRLPRRLFLGNLGRLAGLDLYIRAEK